MNRIEGLIDELCPNGVPYVALGSIVQIANRGVDKVEKPDEDEVFLLNYMDVYRNREIMPDRVLSKTTATKNQIRDCDLQVGDIFITPTSETRDDLAHAAVVVTPLPRTVYSYHVMRLRVFDKEVADAKYLAYQFRSRQLQSQILSASNGITRFGLTKPKWESLLIQLPPLEVQREIVRILDTFTELEAELEVELEARKTQYEHLLKKMLDFSDAETQQVVVSDICRVSRGTVISKDYLRDHPGSFPVYSSQTLNNGIFGYIDTFAYDFESLTWTTDGANAGSMFFHQNEKFTITNVCGLLQVLDPNRVSTRFLYYVLSVEAPKHVSAGMGNPKLMAGTMGGIQIKLPSLQKQEEIVATLNKFDALVNGVMDGLPAEIAARRQQYEYYRNKLLTFKELEAV